MSVTLFAYVPNSFHFFLLLVQRFPQVNFLTSLDHSNQGSKNFMHVRLWNSKTGYGRFECCEGDKRQLMDKAIDKIGDKIVALYPQYW